MSTDLAREDAIPYFLWDEPMTVRELRSRLAQSDEERNRLLGKILREARDSDVWLFTSPEEVSRRWDEIQRFAGRRREFWRFLLNTWRAQGLVS